MSFSLDTSDKIRGDASVGAVVDYLAHGIVGTTVTQLADGQLAATITDIYTAGAVVAVLSITLVNTDTVARTVNLYLTPSGGTARRLIPKDLSLGAGYSLTFDGQKIQVMDTSGNILTSINLASPTFSGTVTISSLTASEIVATNASKALVSLAVATYPSLTELSYVKGVTSALQTQMNLKAPLISPSFTTPTLGAAVGTSLQLSGLTASEILSTDASKNLTSLAVATYPSLAELAYVKGVTSALQTQLGLKAPLASPTFSGTVTLPSTITVGAAVLTFPGATGTFATLAGTEELDGKTLDSSVLKGTFTASGTVTFPSITMAGDILLVANQLRTTNQRLYANDSYGWVMRNSADDGYTGLVVNVCNINQSVTYLGSGYFVAPNVDNGIVIGQARDNGVGLVEAWRVVGAADPYFQMTLAMRLNPIATASLPATPVEGMIVYDDTANKLKVYNGSAWETITSAV